MSYTINSSTKPVLAEQILDKALELGEKSSWEAVHLYAVADELGISLNDIRRYYAQKDDIVEAWFSRADQAALKASTEDGFAELSIDQRLQQIILAWLDALAPHSHLTGEMLAYKFEPGHVHLQFEGIKRISRTVQWFREAAHQNSEGIQRIFEEISLTKIYLSTFVRWLYDSSVKKCEYRQYLHDELHLH